MDRIALDGVKQYLRLADKEQDLLVVSISFYCFLFEEKDFNMRNGLLKMLYGHLQEENIKPRNLDFLFDFLQRTPQENIDFIKQTDIDRPEKRDFTRRLKKLIV